MKAGLTRPTKKQTLSGQPLLLIQVSHTKSLGRLGSARETQVIKMTTKLVNVRKTCLDVSKKGREVWGGLHTSNVVQPRCLFEDEEVGQQQDQRQSHVDEEVVPPVRHVVGIPEDGNRNDILGVQNGDRGTQ